MSIDNAAITAKFSKSIADWAYSEVVQPQLLT